MEDEGYRVLRSAALRDRDEDLEDIRSMRSRDEIDSPDKKARVSKVLADFDATQNSLRARRYGELVPAALEHPPSQLSLATPPILLTATPQLLLMHVRVREGKKEIAPRCGIQATSETTYLELTKLAVLCYMSLQDWERLELLPMIVETFSDHTETERSKTTMPIAACAAVNINRFVCVTIASARAPVVVRRTIAAALMSADKATGFVPQKYEQVQNKELQYPEKLFNEMVEQLTRLDLGVQRSNIDALANFLKALRDAIISCEGTDMAVPATFGNYASRRASGHTSRARADAMLYERRAGALQNLARLPCIASCERWSSFITDVNALVAVLTVKFTKMNRLTQVQKTRHAATRPFATGLAKVETVEAVRGGTTAPYRMLEARLATLGDYECIEVSADEIDSYTKQPPAEAETTARARRHHFRQGLCFGLFAVKRYVYVPGGPKSALLFLWKLPAVGERSESNDSRVQLQIHSALPHYHTRVMHREFKETFSNVGVYSRAILRKMYEKLTSDGSAPQNSATRAVDERVAEFIGAHGDLDLWPDMRALNSGNEGKKYDAFWDAAADEVDSLGVAPADRRGTALYAAQPVSVRDFVSNVTERLRRDLNGGDELPPIPTVDWVKFQFMPRHQTHGVATRYTGKLRLKRVVQSRTLRDLHIDDHFCNSLNMNVNEFLIEIGTMMELLLHTLDEGKRPFLSPAQSVAGDDKSKVACGEPGHAVPTNVRPASASLSHIDVPLLALDHSFHRESFIPSVNLIQDTPSRANGSWRQGRLLVTLRCSVMFPSNPLRHAAELLKQLRHLSGDSALPFLIRNKTDGGPDHNTSFVSVVLSLIGLQRAGSFDIVIAHRPSPGSSFRSEGEHGMSTLNLALQHQSCERAPMPAVFEEVLRSSSSMKKMRAKMASLDDDEDGSPTTEEAQAAWSESIALPLGQIAARFSRLEFCAQSVLVSEQASVAEMEEIVDAIRKIDPSWDETMTTKDAVAKCPLLTEFMATHVHRHKYILEIRKCGDPECKFACLEPRMPRAIFDEMLLRPRFVPLPMHSPRSGMEHFEAYDTLKHQATNDSHMPSFAPPKEPTKEAKEMDKVKNAEAKKKAWHTTKVRVYITCVECNAKRAVFSETKPKRLDTERFETYGEDVMYTCGDSIFVADEKHPLARIFYSRRALVCFMPQEKVMYSSKLFPDFCAICATDDQSLLANMESEEVKALCAGKRAYPICEQCLKEGYAPVTHGSADKTGASYKRKRGGSRRVVDEDEDDAAASSDESGESDDDAQLAAPQPKKKTVPAARAAPTAVAAPAAPSPRGVPELFGVPRLCAQFSPSGCSFGFSCKFPDAESKMTLNTCSLCGDVKAHHLCCNEQPLLRDFVGELGGCGTYCFACAAFLGIAAKKTTGDDLQAYYQQIIWTPTTQQSPLTLAALLSWRPRPLLTVFEPFNDVCQVCDQRAAADDADDAPAFMQCSFCNLSYHNSSECLGKAGGALVPKRHVEKEDYEWSCPRCWGPAVAKACRLAEPKPKSKVLGKRVVKKSGKTKPPKNTKKAPKNTKNS